MGVSLTGTKIKDTYDGLLKTTDNGGLGASAKQITDGLGTASPLYLSTTNVGIGVSPASYWTSADNLVVGNHTDSNGITIASSTSGTGSVTFADSTAGGDNTRGGVTYDHATNTMYFRVNNDYKANVDSSGNVLIGNNGLSALSEKLNITGNGIAIEQTDGGVTTMLGAFGSSDVILGAYTSTNVQLRTGNTERMRIDSSGNVLISKTILDLSVVGIEFRENGQSLFTADGDNPVDFNRLTSDGSIALFRKAGTAVGSISVTGSATAYNTSSDYRLKENVVEMTGALDRVDALKPSRFNFIADPEKTVDGFLAHEVAEIVPEAVTGEKDAMRDEEYEVSPAVYENVVHPAEEAVYETIEHPAIAEELDADGNIIVEAQEAWTEQVLVSEAKEEWTEKVLVSEAVMGTRSVPDYQGIDQSKIVPLLVAAIQELKAEVDALKGA